MTEPQAETILAPVATRGATVILAMVAFALILIGSAWFTLSGGAPLPIDTWWHSAVGLSSDSFGVKFAVALAHIGSAVGVTVCVLLAATWLFIRGRRFDALTVILSAATGVLASELLKMFVARPRPDDRLLDPSGFSFPSGHSMGAAMLATALVYVLLVTARTRLARIILLTAAFTWVLLMMWSRTALHVHWLSDTVAGALLGWCAAVLVRAALLSLWRATPSSQHRAASTP